MIENLTKLLEDQRENIQRAMVQLNAEIEKAPEEQKAFFSERREAIRKAIADGNSSALHEINASIMDFLKQKQ